MGAFPEEVAYPNFDSPPAVVAASPVLKVPFRTEIETLVGSTAGFHLCFFAFCFVGAVGSWLVGEATSCGWVNA